MSQEPNGNGGGDLGEAIAKARLADYKEMLDVTVRAIEAGGEEAGPSRAPCRTRQAGGEPTRKNILAVVIVDQALEIVRTRRD